MIEAFFMEKVTLLKTFEAMNLYVKARHVCTGADSAGKSSRPLWSFKVIL